MAPVEMVGRYRVGDSIGKGAFATVFKGLDTETGGFVAIKQVSLSGIPKDQLQDIEMEITLLRKLHHTNIVRYLGSERTKDYLYIIVEYVENGSLQGIVKKFGNLREELIAVYMSQVIAGLIYLHDQGVIHRDIKGANILTTKEGHVKLTDFGVSTKLSEANANDVVGTPYWMAPEIVEMLPPSTASDIWSVGCTVVELLSGEPPYFELAPMPALYRIVQDDHPPLPDNLSPALRDFLMQCFQKDPTRRVSGAKLMKHAWIQNAIKRAQNSRGAARASELGSDGASGAPSPINRRTPNAASPGAAATSTAAAAGKKNLAKYAEGDDEDEDWGDMGDDDADTIEIKPAPGRGPGHKPKSGGKTGPGQQALAPGMLLERFREDDDEFDDLIDDGDGDVGIGTGTGTGTGTGGKGRGGGGRGAGTGKAAAGAGTDVFARIADDDDGEIDLDDLDEADLGKKLKNLHQQGWNKNAGDDASDVFDAFDEDFDDQDFTETNKREEYNRQTTEVMNLIAKLQGDPAEETIHEACDALVGHFQANPELRLHLVTHHGIVPIMELLETHASNVQVTRSMLAFVNQFIGEGDKVLQIQENLCNLGAIPAIMRFASSDYSYDIREQAAIFVGKICKASPRTLQMFIACRGLPVLAELLAMEYSETTRHLIFDTLSNVTAVFELQSTTPRNDFCRLFVKGGLLAGLSSAIVSLHEDRTNASAAQYLDAAANLFLIFSNADPSVKRSMSEPVVLRAMLGVLDKDSTGVLITMLKAIKFLSMSPDALEPLQEAGVFEKIIPFLAMRGTGKVNEIHNQVLNTMYNLCRVNRVRVEQAVLNGIIPHLQHFITTNSPVKEFALPIFVDVSHASKLCRQELWKHDGVQFYVGLLSGQEYWHPLVLEAIATWISDEPRRVEAVLQKPGNIEQLVGVFSRTNKNTVNLLMDPLLKILTVSLNVNRAVARAGFISHLLTRLTHPDAIVRVSLLKILKVFYEFHNKPKRLIQEYNLFPVITEMRDGDTSVMVQEMAGKLIDAFHANSVL